jgi:hypothetical protein
MASSIDLILREMHQVNTFTVMEKTGYKSGRNVVCPALMKQRDKITDIYFLQGINCTNLVVNERAVLIGPYVLMINTRF